MHRLLIPVLRRHGRLYLSEFKGSLVYKESSWIARQSQRETLSQKKKKKEKEIKNPERLISQRTHKLTGIQFPFLSVYKIM